MQPGAPRRRRPRPVADAPIDALVAGEGRDLARAWAIALLEQWPLDAASAIPAADLAREAPALAAAVVRALASDADLARLAPGGDLEPLASRAGRLAGAQDPASAAAAVDALRAVVAAAALAALPDPSPEQVADLAERLAHVASTVLGAALGEPAARPAEVAPGAGRLAPEHRSGADGWHEALADHVAAAAGGGQGLALLLVEVDDADRLRAAEPEGAAAVFGAVGRAVRAALRRADVIGCEDEGRVWVIAPGTARRGAEALAGRLVEAVESAGVPRGAPVGAAVGLAVYGEDGWDAERLVARAEEAALAMRASGVGRRGPPGGGEAPPSGPRLVR